MLTSRERLVQTINHKEPDHVPLYFKWWSRPFLLSNEKKWPNQFERVRDTLNLGLDDTLMLEPPRSLNPDLRVKKWKKTFPGERCPILIKEYRIAKHTLRHVVRQTDDWPFGDDIPLFTDYNVPRARTIKYLIEKERDVEALSRLFREPDYKELEAFHEEAEGIKRFAKKYGVLVECGGSPTSLWKDAYGLLLGDALGWLCGIENSLLMAFKDPDLLHRILDTLLEWNMRYIRMVSEVGGAEVIVHRGWYESSDFWSPRLYNTFFVPRIKSEIEAVHKAGIKFCYIMSTGMMPFLKAFREMGIDIFYGLDPVQGGADLGRAKREVGDKICLWGGVNSAVTLAHGNKQQIENAVTEAIRILGPSGGFILSAIDQLFEEIPWDNIMTMVETWRRKGIYPLLTPENSESIGKRES